MTICATLVAPGSLTAQAPVRVAIGETWLSPLQPWQLTQACWNTILPRASAVWPSLCPAGAAGAIVAGRSGEVTAGTLRRYATIALMSSGASLLRLWSTASPIGPDAVPRPLAWPVERYAATSSSLQLPRPVALSEEMLNARQPAVMAPANLLRLSSANARLRGVWH